MRRVAITPAFVAVAVAAALGTAAASGAPDAKRIAGYCSRTGDLCYGIQNRGGAVYLDIATIERYFGRYRLCVRPPGGGAAGLERCGSFPIRRRGPVWGSTVKYGRQFPVVGPGVYRVTWKLGKEPLGPTLRFRLPLAA